MKPPYPTTFVFRLLEGLVRVLHLLRLPALYTAASGRFKGGYRRLTDAEIALARPIFGDSIDYSKVRLDERARIVCRARGCAYVSFNLINTWGPLRPATLIHELVHIWQYQRLGPVYIPRALWAQHTAEGYNYGGIAALRRAAGQGRGLLAFNYEQQGDIVADYWRLRNGEKPLWCAANPEHLAVFEAVIYADLR